MIVQLESLTCEQSFDEAKRFLATHLPVSGRE